MLSFLSNQAHFIIPSKNVLIQINEIVCRDCRMSIRMIAKTVNADKENIRKILHDELNMIICVKLVPKSLISKQKLVCQ